MINTKKKIALITGAGSGIGLSAAKSLVASGFLVILTGRSQEKLDKAAAQFEQGQVLL